MQSNEEASGNISSKKRASLRSLRDEGFKNREALNKYVSGVLAIISAEFFFSSLIQLGFGLKDEIKEWFYDRDWICWVFLSCAFVFFLMLSCSEEKRQSYPQNVLFLTLMVLSTGLFTGGMLALYDKRAVTSSFWGASVMTFSLSFLVRYCRFRVTNYTFILSGGIMGFLGFIIPSVVMTSLGIMRLFDNVLWCFSVIFFGLYLTWIIQIIVDGQLEEVQVEDYAHGTILVHISPYFILKDFCICCTR